MSRDNDKPSEPSAGQDSPHLLRRLRVRRELGAGQHGTVHLGRVEEAAFGLEPGTEVAIKFLHLDLLDDPRWLARFRREAAIGGKIRHPNVVRIHGIEEGRMLGLKLAYLVMDFVRGRTLRQLLSEHGAATEALVRRVGSDAARGLAALHSYGIVHRDLKPENLYLADEGATKIMDLGFAHEARAQREARGSPVSRSGSPSRRQQESRSASSSRSTSDASSGRGSPSESSRWSSGSGVGGTLPYTAPECLRGRPATAASDLYSLGVVLFELATGEHPFAARCAGDVDALIEAQLAADPPLASSLRPRLSPLLDRVLQRLLERDPRARLHDADQLARILEEGERSNWWIDFTETQPFLDSQRRLRASRRPAHTELLGRGEELAWLEHALDGARSGALQVLWLHGPEGAGKRRLVDEFVARSFDSGHALNYFAGEPRTKGRGRPIDPIGSFLVEAYSRANDLTLPDRSHKPQLIEMLAHRLEIGAPLIAEDARRLARALLTDDDAPALPIDAAAQALRALGQRDRPLVLRIHRADALDRQSVALLERLAQSSRGADQTHILAIVSSHREAPAPDLAALPRMRIELGELDQDSARRFVRALFAEAEEGERAADFLLAQLAPIPGLLLDVLALLVEHGELTGRPLNFAQLSARPSLPIEGRLENFLSASWDRLAAKDRELLEAAAVFGTEFRASDLAKLVDQSELEVLAQLSALRERWVLAQREYHRFRRRSQRSHILGRMDRDRRMRLHGQAAAILEARSASRVRVALQWSRAGEHDKALPMLLAAAERQFARGTPEDAAPLLRRAELHLDALGAPARDQRRDRWRRLRMRVDLALDDPEAALTRVAEATDDVEAIALHGRALAALDRVSVADALLASAVEDGAAEEFVLDRCQIAVWTGRLRDAARQTTALLEILLERASSQDEALIARSYFVAGLLAAERLRVAHAENLLKEAEERWLALDDERAGRRCLLARAELRLRLGDAHGMRRLLGSFQPKPNSERVIVRELSARALILAGDPAIASRELDAASKLAQRPRERLSLGLARLATQSERALETCDRLRREALELGHIDLVHRLGARQARIVLGHGLADAALALCASWHEASESPDAPSLRPETQIEWTIVEALARRAKGQEREAQIATDHARRFAKRLEDSLPRRERRRFSQDSELAQQLALLTP